MKINVKEILITLTFFSFIAFLSFSIIGFVLKSNEKIEERNEQIEEARQQELASAGVFEYEDIKDADATEIKGILRATASISHYSGGSSIEVTYVLYEDGTIKHSIPPFMDEDRIRYPYTDQEAKVIIEASLEGKLIESSL